MPIDAAALELGAVLVKEYALDTYWEDETVLLLDSVTGAATDELELDGAEYAGADETLEETTATASVDVDAGALDNAGALDEVAAAVDELLLSSLPVGVSPDRTQPVLSVSAFGQVTCW